MSELISENNGFICKTDNYEKLEGLGKYRYEVNGLNDFQIDASPNSTAITVSENHFKINPIKGINNQAIEEKIICDDNILNIVVPISRKKYEGEIKESFKEHFLFEKVSVDNIYNEELGLSLNKMTKEKLNINIIYAQDNQEYFTFNPQVETENQNKIIDPIAIIYMGNTHSKFALSAYSKCFYFLSDKLDAFDDIIPILVDNKATEITSNIITIYDEYGQSINEMQTVRNNMTILIIVIFIANIMILYSVMSFQYEKNKYKLYLQKILGYTFFKKNKGIILLLTLNSAVPMIYFLLSKNIIFFIYALGYLAFEYLVIYVLDKFIGNKSFNFIIKGEHYND